MLTSAPFGHAQGPPLGQRVRSSSEVEMSGTNRSADIHIEPITAFEDHVVEMSG